jgi:MarR family transcriptional regulator, transcriptional regulator for hemolysin
MTKVRERSGMGTRSSEFRIGFLVHDVSRLRQILFDQAMKPHGVTRAQWWTLAQLSRAGGEGMAQTELARHLGLGKVAVGGMIDRLEGGGLVARRIDAADRRINRIHLTPRGHAILDRMVAVGRRLNKVILDGVSAADLAVADQVLTRLRRNLRAVLEQKD